MNNRILVDIGCLECGGDTKATVGTNWTYMPQEEYRTKYRRTKWDDRPYLAVEAVNYWSGDGMRVAYPGVDDG